MCCLQTYCFLCCVEAFLDWCNPPTYFSFIACASEVLFKKSLPTPIYSNISPAFFLQAVFIVWSFTIKLSKFESWVDFHMEDRDLVSFFCSRIMSFPSTICGKYFLFSTGLSCTFCKKSASWFWIYFWTCYSVSLIYVSVFVPVSCSFDYYNFKIYSFAQYCLRAWIFYNSR